MLRRVSLAIVAAGFAFQSVTAVADPLQPTGKWVVDYRTDQCLASREYGTSDSPVILGIRPAPDGNTYLLLVAEKHKGPASGEEHQGTVDFGEAPIKSWLLEYRVEDSDIHQMRLSAAQMNEAKSDSDMKLVANDGRQFDLQLQSMPALLKSLEQCTADLKRYWNWNGDKDGRITTEPKGSLVNLFSRNAYPEEALSRRQEGTAQFLLLIDENGKVAGCDVILASGIPALDVEGCQVIRSRAKFTPARDRAGNPVRSTVVTPPVTWMFAD